MTADELGVWEPLDPASALALLESLDVPWWVAGGWAIDLFHGAPTRAHGDFDIEVLRRDQLAVRRHLRSWDIHTARAGELRPLSLDAELPADVNSVWCRSEPGGPWQLQIMLAPTLGDLWLYRRDPRVTRPIAELGYQTSAGVPVLWPEIQLLYKATGPELAKNLHDLRLVANQLTAGQRAWLVTALELAHPGHPWLALLEPSA